MTQRLDAIVRSLAIPNGPGGAIAVIKDGRPIYQSAVGYADVENKSANTPATNFRLASVTKQFTAAAVLLLVDDGKVTLETRLTDAFPGLPAYARDVTLRHLLNHTSGPSLP